MPLIFALVALIAVIAGTVRAQYAPPTFPPNSVFGRLNPGSPDGQGEAIPFSTLSSALDLPSNVKAYGALGNGANDDTAAIQAALNAVASTGGVLFIPPGTYEISSALTTGCGLVIKGGGSAVTTINQKSPTANGLWVNNTGSPCPGNFLGVAISGLRIVAGGGVSGVVNSLGTGLLVTQFNAGFSADDIVVLSFGTAVDAEDVWNSRFHGVNGWWYNIGLQIGCNLSFATAAGTEFSQVYFYNNPGPFGGTSVGLKECSSGGYIFKHAEFGSANTGVLLQPQSGQQILYDQWDQVIADTNLADGIDVDCTNGNIAAITATNVHAGFNNGVGLKVLGTNARCTALSFQGRFRENGLQGVLLNFGTGIAISNSQINANGRLSLTMTNPGVSYIAGDTLTLSGGTGGPLTIGVLSVNGSGAITAWDVVGSTYYSSLPSSPNSPTGGHGSGATFTFSSAGYPLPGIETASTIAAFTIVGDIIGNIASSSNAQGPCYKADTALFGQQFFAGNNCISPQGGALYSGALAMTMVNDVQFNGFQLRNSSNAVAALTGNGSGGDDGALNLNNAGALTVDVQASGTSFLNGGAVTVGPNGMIGAIGELGGGKISATGTAPGAGFAKVEWVAGTNAGTCKLIAYAGTSTTPTTIIDNVGGGC